MKEPVITCEVCGGPLPADHFDLEIKARPLCGMECIKLWAERDGGRLVPINEYLRRNPGPLRLEDK